MGYLSEADRPCVVISHIGMMAASVMLADSESITDTGLSTHPTQSGKFAEVTDTVTDINLLLSSYHHVLKSMFFEGKWNRHANFLIYLICARFTSYSTRSRGYSCASSRSIHSQNPSP